MQIAQFLRASYSTFKAARVWMTFWGTHLEKMPYSPYRILSIPKMMTTPKNVFHSCYLDTRLSFRYQIFCFTRNWVVNKLQSSEPTTISNNEPKRIIQMKSPLMQSRASHILWETAPKEKQLLLDSVFWDFSHRHDNSTQGQLYLAL